MTVDTNSVASSNGSSAIKDDDVFLVDPSVKARRRERTIVIISRIVLGATALLLWEGISGRLVDEFWISKPSSVVKALISLWNNGLVANTYATVCEALVGFGFGALAGMLIGLLFGSNRLIAKILDPYLVGFYSIPRIALIPLLILWFGIGFQTKVIFTSLLVFFPVFMNTLAGVRDVNLDLIDVLRVMGASKTDTIRKVLIPSALAWLFAGLRISVPYALIGAVVAEMFTSNIGLGFLISYHANILDTAGLFAALAVTTVLGLLLHASVVKVERHLLRWRPAGDTSH